MAEVVDDNGGVRLMVVDDNGGVRWRCCRGEVEGDVKQIIEVNFEVGKPLNKGIKELELDGDVDAFLMLDYENRMSIDLYVEHHDYDVLDFLLEKNDEPYPCSASNDKYCSDDESVDTDDVDFHIKGEHNDVLKHFTTT
ncbi:hypothetical protein Tco_0775628 [Tanacetum coccineum]